MNNDGKRSKYIQKLYEVGDLKGYSPIFSKLHEVAADPSSSAADLANVILHDHAFTSKVLKTANSSFYHYQGKITTLTQAIVIMGFKSIKNLALSLSVYNQFKDKSNNKDFHYRNFWVHSLTTAITAHWLCEKIDPMMKEEMFVAGFLHDIGKLIIGTSFQSEYKQILKKIKQGNTELQSEFKVIGMNHTEVGAFLGKMWGFPSGLIGILKNHHVRPSWRKIGHIEIVYFANLLANSTDLTTGKMIADDGKMFFIGSSHFKIKKAEIEEFQTSLMETVSNTAKEFDIPMDEEYYEVRRDEKPPVDNELNARMQQEFENIKQKLSWREREARLTSDLVKAYYDMKRLEDVLMALSEGIYRELRYDVVVAFLVDKKDNTLNGNVGFGIESQSVIKSLKYNIKKSDNIFVNSVINNSFGRINNINKKNSKNKIDHKFHNQFNLIQFAYVPISIWQDVQALIVFGSNNEEHPINDEILNSIHTLSIQASMAVERFSPRPV
jgi:putative nucleotidyltransferase with HDIG domain